MFGFRSDRLDLSVFFNMTHPFYFLAIFIAAYACCRVHRRQVIAGHGAVDPVAVQPVVVNPVILDVGIQAANQIPLLNHDQEEFLDPTERTLNDLRHAGLV